MQTIYLHSKTQFLHSYIHSGRYGFILPREQIMPTANETYVGIKAMAQAVFEKLQVSNNTNTGA